MRGHCGSDCWRLSSRVLLTYLEMMPVSGRLCLKTSYLEGINWIPSVSFCVHVQQLNADYVIAEAQQAMSHELLMAFHSVCTTLCQCCACEPPRSTNWSQRPSFIDSIWVIFLDLCVCVCLCICVCLPECFSKPPLTTANKQSCKGRKSLGKTPFLTFKPMPLRQSVTHPCPTLTASASICSFMANFILGQIKFLIWSNNLQPIFGQCTKPQNLILPSHLFCLELFGKKTQKSPLPK